MARLSIVTLGSVRGGVRQTVYAGCGLLSFERAQVLAGDCNANYANGVASGTCRPGLGEYRAVRLPRWCGRMVKRYPFFTFDNVRALIQKHCPPW